MPKLSIQTDGTMWQKVLVVVITLAAAGLAAWLLTFINGKVFKAIGRKQRGIHLVFFERLNKWIIVIAVFLLALSALDGSSSVWKTMLGGTAVVSAVIAFAAQDVVKDIIAGLMISLHKPFEIGDRIELEDGTAGIVMDITNRHVVLMGVDTIRYIVPNSRINAMNLTNYSYHRSGRSAKFLFPVGYDTDLDLAKSVIQKAIADCPLTKAGFTDDDGLPSYGRVYFMKFESSALILQTTVIYESRVPSERLIDAVNSSVREALINNGIEIPYEYVNVLDAGRTGGR